MCAEYALPSLLMAGSLVRRLAFWVGQDVDVAGYVRSCQTCQRTNLKVEHCCPRGLLYPLSRSGGTIGVDWIAGLPTTAAGFNMIQNHVDPLSLAGKVHAVPTRSTVTAADAAAIIRDMCLRSCDAFPDALVRLRARCSRLRQGLGLVPHISAQARRITRTPTLRWSAPTVPSATHCAPR